MRVEDVQRRVPVLVGDPHPAPADLSRVTCHVSGVTCPCSDQHSPAPRRCGTSGRTG